MSIYKAPDGSKYNIPSEPNERAQFVAAVKERYGEDLDQTSTLGQVGEFVKAIPRGAAGLALDVPTGIVGLFDIGNDSNLYKGLEGLQDKLRQESPLAADPRYADKFSTKLGEGIGSFGPFLGAGLVGRALSKAPGAAKGLLSPTFTAPAALAIPTGIAAQGDRLRMARDMGEDVSGLAETTAELFGGVIGITEVLPIANILGKVHKNAPLSTKERLVSALQSGAAEGGQEVAAGILQDLTARGLYSDELPIGESMFEEFTIGGIIGGAADLVVSSMAGKKAVRDKQMEEEGLRAEEKKEQLILAKKAELAQEQGVLDVVEDTQIVTVPQIPAPKEVAVEPQVEIIETPDNKFSLIDISNPDSPVVLDTKDKQTDAAIAKQKLLDTFDVAQLKDTLDNDTYNLGMVNSSTAYEIGQSILDTKASDVGIQQLINTVPKDSKSEVKLRGLVNSFVAQNPNATSSSYPRIKMSDAKQLLTPKEFNDFASAYAKKTFQISEKKGEPSIIADKQQPDTKIKYVKEIAESKNIDLDFNSPAVQYAAEKYTGTADYKKMNKGQKELFLAKLHSLPKFNSRTTFPDFRPRDYSAQDMADFVAGMKENNMTFNKKSLEQIDKGQQFLDDLIYSGRAEKVEGTNNYKIRDNFEFDIARRAEGFNETPEEFGARLTAQQSENKLTPEGIAELVEKEKIRQERLLPPAEVIPKTINYAETLEEGKTNKFAKEVRKNLDKIGLKDTGIVVSNDILSTTTLQKVGDKIVYDPREVQATETEGAVQGEYDRNTDTIFLSLNAVNPDGNATDIEIQQRLNKILDHEMIHALRAKDLITAKEYSYLTKMVKKTKYPNRNQTFYKEAEQRTAKERVGRPAAMQEELIVEEAIAEYFANKDLLVNTPPKVEGIFNKIIEFFKSMGQAMRSSGYKNAQDVFNDIESGRVGSRERDVIRTTRLGDKERTMFLDRIPEDQPVPPRTEVPGEEVVSTLKPRGIRPISIPKPKPTPPTPPAGPTTPPTTPTSIYNARNMTGKQLANERDIILLGLQKAGITKRRRGDSVKVMKWVKDNAPSKDYEIIAGKVYQSLLALEKKGYSFPFFISQNQKDTGGFRGRVSYSPMLSKNFSMTIADARPDVWERIKNNELSDTQLGTIQAKNTNGVNFETILHEGIHQATLAQMELAGGPGSKNKKIAKAYKDLQKQRETVEKFVTNKLQEMDKLSNEASRGVITAKQFINNFASLPASFRNKALDIYMDAEKSTPQQIVRNSNAVIARKYREFTQELIDYKINGMQRGSALPDSSEFLTFGLTNRDFQELLESIPTKTDPSKTVWDKFVETIRNVLGLPAKLNTELSAFLKNASTVLDLQDTGVPGFDTRQSREDAPLKTKQQRDESSGHVADYVPAQYGPPAHNLNEMPSGELSPEGYSTFAADVDYNRLRDYSTARPQERAEEQRFLNKLKQIKGNPNATITMYQAAPSRDLQEGDLITPFLSEAEALVEDSKVTQQEIRDADRARRRQEQIDKTGAVDLRQEQLYNQMDNIMDVFGAPQITPSTVHTYELKAGDVRWDGNNGWFRWGYFPSKVKDISGDIPTFSREADQAYFNREKTNKLISNLESSIYYKEAQLNQERSYMTDATARRLEREIEQERNQIAELKAGDIPLFSRGRRDATNDNTQENIQLKEAVKEAEELAENTARGGIPTYNTNASDTALKAALDFNKDLSSEEPGDIPTFSRPGFDGVDASIVEGINRTGSKTSPKNSMGYRYIDEVKDNISPRLKYFFNNFRTQFVDKLDKIDQLIIKASEENEQVRRANNTADTATIAALRMADRARGLFQGMLTKGYIDSVIEGVPALSNTKALKISTRYNQFLEGNVNTGGLMQILAPLYDSQVDKESIFKYYAMAKRTQGFDKRGRVVKSPIKEKDIQNIKKIEQQYPEVVEAYNNYQLWNNKLIEFATKKGILSNTRSTNELAEDISKITKEDVKELEKLSYDDLMNRVLEINKKLPLQQKIETRGTAQIWQENSDYYPFYKKMSDESTAGPRIASGALPNNPLDIKLTGSEEAVDVDVIEAISRNSLSILTAALKNDGVSKLIRDLQSLDMAKPITPEQAGKADSIFVFENGIKKHYQVESIETFEALTAIGGTPTGFWTTLVGAPAGLLRDTVTRDPGFVAINILRDTMSTMVTSGANYTPVIDSVKNMFADMHELERFGVLGGYDFANDEGSVKRYLKRTMRQQGMTEQNGMSASGAFFKLWDGLGALTTKSDGATRLAVYNAVYDKLISEGATQAQAQSEAAYQALEVINFGRRGLNPGFRFITAAIPFLNARVQGLDVLWRSSTGRYSAVEKLGDNQTLKDVQRKIQTNMLTNASILMGITLAYYLMYHDDEEYKNLKREVRDDNWVFPISKDLAFKVPIPFEVGLLFKVVPERVFDMTLGDDRFTKKSLNEAKESITRGAQTSLNIPFFQPGGGFQILKPISEAINNKNTFTGTEIVPYYQQKKEPGLQSRPTTNYLIKSIGEFLNISPSKMEHVVRGYTGSLGAHVLNVVDMTARGVTGEPILPSNVSLNKIPLINRLLTDIDKSGGYQQQFYELRNEVDRAVQTMNALEKAGRYDELLAYRSNIRGLLDIKNEARRIDRYLTKWRLRRDAIMNNPNMSVSAKSDAIRELELERDKRLAFVPEMRKRADIPFINMNIF